MPSHVHKQGATLFSQVLQPVKNRDSYLWSLDINMASGSSPGKDICMTFGGNVGHGCWQTTAVAGPRIQTCTQVEAWAETKLASQATQIRLFSPVLSPLFWFFSWCSKYSAFLLSHLSTTYLHVIVAPVAGLSISYTFNTWTEQSTFKAHILWYGKSAW